MLTRFVFLYGPPASGKSLGGQHLAANLQCPFYDLDREIELLAGKTIPEIFAEEDEAGFRERETAALHEIIARPAGVVALGGGALVRPENRELAETHGQVICLSAEFATILERLGDGSGGRPLLDGDVQLDLKQLLAERVSHYSSFSIQIITDHTLIDDVVYQIQTQLGFYPIRNMGSGYDVRFCEGSFLHLDELIHNYASHGRLALVSDENVARHYLTAALDSLQVSGIAAQTITLPPGEETKTFQTIQLLLETFASAGLDRSSTVVSLGGGVIGDLTGFAAAIYMRGVNWITIPTSLLAMVDASLGGKTGVDLPQGKNLVGAFHPPQLVLIDPKLLSTLPEIELRNGLAEVIKHSILADRELFKRCKAGLSVVTADLAWIVRRAMAVKVRVIEQDPYEHGRRASLNLGHTLGHGLELVTGFQLKHGEAVAVGMVAAARLSEKMGLAEAGLSDEIEACLSQVGLPTSIPNGIDRGRLLDAMALDKKRRFGHPRIVLPVAIGDVRWGVEIDDFARLIEVMG